MVRLSLKRTVKNFTIFIAIVITYFWLFSNSRTPIKDFNQDTHGMKKLLIDNFWVPEKQLQSVRGLGDGGKAVKTSAEEAKQREKAYAEYGFNQFISDKISLNRTVPDTRPREYVSHSNYQMHIAFFSWCTCHISYLIQTLYDIIFISSDVNIDIIWQDC